MCMIYPSNAIVYSYKCKYSRSRTYHSADNLFSFILSRSTMVNRIYNNTYVLFVNHIELLVLTDEFCVYNNKITAAAAIHVVCAQRFENGFGVQPNYERRISLGLFSKIL